MFIAALLCFALAQDPVDERPAQRLAEAELLASKGKWTAAKNKYWNLHRNWKGTPEAEIADMRLNIGWLGVIELDRRGPSANRVDVVVTGDAFELQELGSLEGLSKDVVLAFDRNPTLGEYASCFNFFLMGVFSKEGGVSGLGRDNFDNAFGAKTSGDKTHVRTNRGLIRRALGEMKEHDNLAVVLVDKPGLLGTGGGGVATVAGRPDKNTVIHEWGHAFAGLADEYSSDAGYTGDPRQSANLSTTDDPTQVPWKHFFEEKTYRRKIGVHRGGGGRAKGTWKATVRGCVMDGSGDYCPVCREQVVLTIYRYVDPVDSFTPENDFQLKANGPLQFAVTPIQGKKHDLNVEWWVLEGNHPGKGDRLRTGPSTRLKALVPIVEAPVETTRPRKGGIHRFVFDPENYGVGPHTIICRVTDPAVVKKEPWVLRDPQGLLTSERRWVVGLTQSAPAPADRIKK